MISTNFSILILQHPGEKKSPLNTATLVESLFSPSLVQVGLSWPNLSRAWGQNTASEKIDPKEWGVFFLGTQKHTEKLKALTEAKDFKKPALFFVSKKGDPLPATEQAERAKKITGLVFLDGTWPQSKSIWWRNPWLLKLQRMVLIPEEKSLYGKIRKEPRATTISTAESVGLAITLLSGSPEPYEQIKIQMSEFIQSLPLRPSRVAHPKEN